MIAIVEVEPTRYEVRITGKDASGKIATIKLFDVTFEKAGEVWTREDSTDLRAYVGGMLLPALTGINIHTLKQDKPSPDAPRLDEIVPLPRPVA
jgi:hypothetical protein